MNDIEVYSKETLNDKIHRLITTNVQLIVNKMKIEKVKINLKPNKIQLFGKKNSLVTKREELRTEIIVLNIIGPLNIPIRGHQDLRLTQNKLKTKRPPFFDSLKKNF